MAKKMLFFLPQKHTEQGLNLKVAARVIRELQDTPEPPLRCTRLSLRLSTGQKPQKPAAPVQVYVALLSSDPFLSLTYMVSLMSVYSCNIVILLISITG